MFTSFRYLTSQPWQQQLLLLQQDWHIQSISVFGSALGENFHDASDIDLLFDFEAGQEPSYFELALLKQALENIFQRKVDLVTRAGLFNSHNPERAQSILNSCQPLHLSSPT